MTYRDAVHKINSLLRFGMKPGLERIQALLDRMGNPQKQLKFVHVAGTNGKGSVCSYIDDILKKSGYKTGLFTSPHLVTIRERIQVDGELISREDFTQYFNKVYETASRAAK